MNGRKTLKDNRYIEIVSGQLFTFVVLFGMYYVLYHDEKTNIDTSSSLWGVPLGTIFGILTMIYELYKYKIVYILRFISAYGIIVVFAVLPGIDRLGVLVGFLVGDVCISVVSLPLFLLLRSRIDNNDKNE